MSADAAVNPDSVPVIRTAHVPGRPYLTTGEASRRLGKSLYWVSERIKNGTLEGYGIRANQRTTWYLFASAVEEIERLENPDRRPTPVEPLPEAAQLVTKALSAMEKLRTALLAERKVMAQVTSGLLAEVDGWHDHAFEETANTMHDLRVMLLEGPLLREPYREAADHQLQRLDRALRAVQLIV